MMCPFTNWGQDHYHDVDDSFGILVNHAQSDTSQFKHVIEYFTKNKLLLDSAKTLKKLSELAHTYRQQKNHEWLVKTNSVLAWHYVSLGLSEEGKSTLRTMQQHFHLSNIPKLEGKTFLYLMFMHDHLGAHDSSKICYDRAIDLFEQTHSTEELAKTHKWYAMKYRLMANPDSALALLSITDSLNRELNDSILMADCYTEKGLNYTLQNKYIKALQVLSMAHKIYSDLNDQEGMNVTKLNSGNAFLGIEDYDMAQRTYLNALKGFRKDNSEEDYALIYNNMALVHYHQENYTRALNYLDSALVIANSFKKKHLLGDIYSNRGLCYMDLEQYDSAIVNLNRSLAIETHLNDKYGIGLCLVNLYNCYFLSGNQTEASRHKNLAFKASKEGIDLRLEFDLYTYLSQNYLSQGDSSNALMYHLKMASIQDSIYKKDRSSLLSALQNNMDYLNIQKSLNSTKKKLNTATAEREEISAKNDYLKSKNQTIIILSVLVGLTLTSLIIFLSISIKRKKRMNQMLSDQTHQLEIQNKAILSSADYARSMEKMLIQQMNPHFIFNALTTVEAGISTNDAEFTKRYIHALSKILRRTLDHSRQSSISLTSEIDYLKDYVALYQLKADSAIDCSFIYHEEEVDDFVNTPPMLIQPFIENALMHGLYHKTHGQKILKVKVSPEVNHIIWVIEDNGIGRKEAARISQTHTGTSHGMSITADRIKWLRNIYKTDFSVTYEDLDQGTRVTIKTPIA